MPRDLFESSTNTSASAPRDLFETIKAPVGANNAITQPEVSPLYNIPQNKADTGILGGPIQAVARGIPRGVADVGLNVIDLVGELMTKIEPLKGAGSKLRQFNKGSQKINSELSEVEQANPISSAVGRGTGAVGGLAGLTRLGGATVAGQMAAQGLLGASEAGEGNRGFGLAAGALLPAAVSKVAGSPSAYIASTAAQEPAIKALKTSINTPPKQYPNMDIYEATNASFAKFKEAPGAILTVRPQKAIEAFKQQYSPLLTNKQAGAINDLEEGIKNAKTIEELHDARKAFSAEAKSFYYGDNALSGKGRLAIKNLQENIENNLQVNAQKLGVLDQYKEANMLFKQSKEADIINKAFDRTKTAVGDNEWKAFNQTLLKLKKEDAAKLSPSTNQAIEGIRKILFEANHIYDLPTRKLWITPVLTLINGMFNNTTGKFLLQKAGTANGRKIAKSILESTIVKAQGGLLKELNPPEQNEQVLNAN